MNSNLTHRTAVAPPPGLGGRAAVFSQTDDVHLAEHSANVRRTLCECLPINERTVIEAALIGLPGHQHV